MAARFALIRSMRSPVAWLVGLRRWLLWSLLAAVVLQGVFLGRIALMAWVDPASTAFRRSEWGRRAHTVWQARAEGRVDATPAAAAAGSPWRQTWVDADRISVHLKRAVIASEDDGFATHGGVDWDAIESAWTRNQQRAARAQRSAQTTTPRLVGGSTITQQLAKNLLLSGGRHLPRKAQELVLTLLLEALLDKPRILEIYLNSVEWGDGVFGAEAAAQRYFGVSAAQLSPEQAARLAVMLPAPKAFERRPQSAYLSRRSATILARMPSARLP